MARVPPEEIERLKAEISVQRLAEARGIVLKPHGKNLIGLCPFHEDHDPSLVITPEKNLWNCLGACGRGGSVIDWVMKAESVSFPHAVQILRELPEALMKSKNLYDHPPVTRRCERLLPNPFEADMTDRQIMAGVVAYYHESLKKCPDALDYLAKRGLKHPEMIEHFKLGFVDRTLCYRLPDKSGRWGAALRQRLWHLGITRKSGHEHFINFLTVPVFDESGGVTEIYGRRISKKPASDIPNHLYLPGPHKGVFNWQALAGSKDVILCEALLDALSFWCAGIRNVTSSYGVNGFTADHLAAFKKYGIERVFIAYDRDDAGEKASQALAEKLIGEGFECFRVNFPRGMDANAYALKVQPPEKSLDLVIRNAVWIGKGKRRPATPLGGRPDRGALPPEEGHQEPAAKGKTVAEEPQAPEPAQEPQPTTAPIPEAPFPLAAEEPVEPPSPAPTEPGKTDRGPEIELRAEEIIMRLDGRRWRIRGLGKNMSYDQLKVNLLVSRGESYFVDTFDLYSARSRAAFQKQAADEMRIKEDVIRSDLGKILLKLEELQDKQIKDALEPKEKAVVLTEAEKAEALELLKDPRLIERILEDFEACGIVGEEVNKLTGYLAAVSRKLETPLAVIIQSSSAAGKTSLMEAVLAFMPEEDRVKYSAMTGQSLFYMGETNLKHKILAIVEEEGAERASYALKLLQSEGELTIASTGKDPQTGRMVTHEYRVEGPVMIFVTTTSIDIDEELQNRCLVLTVNESREQTRAIHKLQRERRTLEGLRARQRKARILQRHRNAQRLLKPVPTINPYAPRLTFLDDRTRTRRDHDRYLDLIEAITSLHQYQRPLQTDMNEGRPYQYLDVAIEDVELANRLMHEVLGRTLDELPPQTRRFLLLLEEMVRKTCERLDIDRTAYRFHRREILDFTGWSYNQLRIHLERLIELEYVLIHGGHQGRRISYELLYDGQGKDGKPFCVGLLDVEAIKSGQSGGSETLWGKRRPLWGGKGNFVPHLSPICSPFVGGVLGRGNEEPGPVSGRISEESLKNAHLDHEEKPDSPRGSAPDKGNGSAAAVGEAD